MLMSFVTKVMRLYRCRRLKLMAVMMEEWWKERCCFEKPSCRNREAWPAQDPRLGFEIALAAAIKTQCNTPYYFSFLLVKLEVTAGWSAVSDS